MRCFLDNITFQISGIVRPFIRLCSQFCVVDGGNMENRGNSEGVDKPQHMRKDIDLIVHISANPYTELIIGVYQISSNDVFLDKLDLQDSLLLVQLLQGIVLKKILRQEEELSLKHVGTFQLLKQEQT